MMTLPGMSSLVGGAGNLTLEALKKAAEKKKKKKPQGGGKSGANIGQILSGIGSLLKGLGGGKGAGGGGGAEKSGGCGSGGCPGGKCANGSCSQIRPQESSTSDGKNALAGNTPTQDPTASQGAQPVSALQEGERLLAQGQGGEAGGPQIGDLAGGPASGGDLEAASMPDASVPDAGALDMGAAAGPEMATV